MNFPEVHWGAQLGVYQNDLKVSIWRLLFPLQNAERFVGHGLEHTFVFLNIIFNWIDAGIKQSN